MKKINEIFYSLQGEGHHTGVPAVFIRFSGCNLHCNFCDTKHESGTMMSNDAIIAEVMKYRHSKLIVLTGGEPSLFIDNNFIIALKEATGMTIAIETNGTHSIPSAIDWITLSPKTGFEGGDDSPLFITKCNELKVVFTGQGLEQYFEIEASFYYLQPCATGDNAKDRINTQATIKAVMDDPRWNLSLQTHKLLNIR
ncbi:MAG: radical SAM protein [Muribaculaceae bacterium]|nr:radical SAM protein [Muribaculaceae bacterium]